MRAKKTPVISIVTPMFNESDLIEQNIGRLCKAMDDLGVSSELMVVNDGSTDDTAEKGAKASAKDPRVKMVSYENNRGRGYAIKYGIAKSTGDIIVVTEGDLSYGDDIVKRLATMLKEGDYDCVVASPHTKGGGMDNVPLRRAFFTKVGNWILKWLMPVKLGTYTGMTRAYKSTVIQSLDLESDQKELHLEIIAKLGSLGYRVGELPAKLAWPKGRKSRKGTFAPWKIIASHLSFGIGEAPLLLLGAIAFPLICVGFILGVYLLVLSFTGTPVSGRPMLTFVPFCIVVGFIILLIGWLAQQNKQLQRQFHRVQTMLLRIDRSRDGKMQDKEEEYSD